MLKEYKHIQQVQGEPRRRWYTDDLFDLIVWFDFKDAVVGFQLCYDKNTRAITWKSPSTYRHETIDAGEENPGKPKMTPILLPDGYFDYRMIAAQFSNRSSDMEPSVADFIYEKLVDYPPPPRKAGRE